MNQDLKGIFAAWDSVERLTVGCTNAECTRYNFVEEVRGERIEYASKEGIEQDVEVFGIQVGVEGHILGSGDSDWNCDVGAAKRNCLAVCNRRRGSKSCEEGDERENSELHVVQHCDF
jgi:hypothetical protein